MQSSLEFVRVSSHLDNCNFGDSPTLLATIVSNIIEWLLDQCKYLILHMDTTPAKLLTKKAFQFWVRLSSQWSYFYSNFFVTVSVCSFLKFHDCVNITRKSMKNNALSMCVVSQISNYFQFVFLLSCEKSFHVWLVRPTLQKQYIKLSCFSDYIRSAKNLLNLFFLLQISTILSIDHFL